MQLLPNYIEQCSATRQLEPAHRPHPVLKFAAESFLVLAAAAFACGGVSATLAATHPDATPACCVTPAVPQLTNTAAVPGQP